MGLRGGGDREPLLAGTYEQGYYGEVPVSEFITGNQLATQIGLTAGTAFNSDVGWLKFSLDNRTLYVAKKPFRYNLNWAAINTVGAVFGTMQVTINGKLYKVRLLKGRGDGLETNITAGYDIQPTWGSEWNRLMYHVSASPNAGFTTSEGISVGDWAQFTNDELGSVGTGSFSLCQESFMINTTRYAVVRYWGDRVAGIGTYAATDTGSMGAWRPCLELVG